MRTLIIEGDLTLCEAIDEFLGRLGYQTDVARNFQDGAYYLKMRHYDLVLTNYTFDDGNLFELIPIIKASSPKTSTIVISAQYQKEFEIRSLQCGADDFLAQPLDFDILLARINARLRFDCQNSIQIQDLLIVPQEEKILFLNRKILLKGKSLEVLIYLATHHHQIVSKEELLNALWKEPEFVTPNVIEVAINQIRQKIDKPFGIKIIETIHKKGYRFCYPSKPH